MDIATLKNSEQKIETIRSVIQDTQDELINADTIVGGLEPAGF